LDGINNIEHTDSKIITPILPGKIHYGRQRIILDFEEVTPANVVDVLNKALYIHGQNRRDCEYLIKYFLGDQDILYRPSPENSNVNNRTVVNYAYPITREIVGYTFGNAIEFVAKKSEKQEEVTKISDMFEYEGSYYYDICNAIYGSICGVSYAITLPSPDISKDNTPDVPFIVDSLDPRYTFVVQANTIGNPQIMSCTVIVRRDGKKEYICYTNKYKMTVTDGMKKIVTEKNPIGLDPITMIENSLFLTGDWEQAISVMNAANLVTSDSLNDIEGTIRSLLVILGAEFDEDDDTDLQRIKKNRLLTLFSGTGGNVDAKYISPQLDSNSVQNIREYLDEARNIITGIPDRESNGNGGDTGLAVMNRNGWTDIEIVARLKELFYLKGKNKQLGVTLAILRNLGLIDKELKVMDIDVKPKRHTLDNISAKTTAFSTLVATGELATIDALELSSLTNRPAEMVERGKQAKKERQEEAIAMAKAAADASGEGNKPAQNGDNKTAQIEKAASGNDKKENK
jgi:SPP1 family phage portal protein